MMLCVLVRLDSGWISEIQFAAPVLYSTGEIDHCLPHSAIRNVGIMRECALSAGYRLFGLPN